ncbi:MAG: toprim domain-containing protein, partial [Gemmataceae bacterium]
MPTPRKKPATEKPTAAEKKAPAPKRAAKAAPKADGGADGPAAAASGGNYQLVVVESPAKAKTINKYLGSGYRVLASYGHVRDLPTRKEKGEEVAGIRIADGWKMRYVVDDGSKDEGAKGGRGKRRSPADILAEIKREASKADRVL